jgi:hypothetical protein
MLLKRVYILFLLLACGISLSTLAQTQKMLAETELNPFADRKATAYYPTVNKIENVESYLSETLSHFNNDRNKLHLIYEKNSPYSKHYLYEQRFNGFPVYNSWVKTNTTQTDKAFSIYDNSYNTEKWNSQLLNYEIARLKNSNADTDFENAFTLNRKILLKEINIAVIDEMPLAVWKYRLFGNNAYYREFLINAQSEILLSIDLNSYNTDSTAQALVFLPDPLTRANKFYNPPFVNDNNGFNPSLDSQSVEKEIKVFFLSDNFFLQNQYVNINDFDAPFIAPATATTPEFFFARSESGFEDANAIYHITEYQKYIQSLGFNLSDYQIQVDPHALNGDDNSLFSPGTVPPRLYFGTGGVEDAEDADVIIHEYNHALSNDANNSNFGSERRALDEGLCDYFATSYSKSIDTFRWADMFTWDGHNEYWNGRTAVSTSIYPNDLSTSIHENGEMWSTALMEIWDAIGREATDKIMLQTLYALSPNMTFANAAQEFIIADTLVYNGIHFCEIYAAFLRRGFVDSLDTNPCGGYDPSILVDAGNDISICPGDSVHLGNNIPNENYSYLWQPDNNLSNNNQPNVNAAPVANTQYILKITTPQGTYNTDTVMVTVKNCEIAVFNTIGFTDGSSELRIYIPADEKNAIIKLFDVAGKQLLEMNKNEQTSYTLNSNPFTSGVYFLSVYTSEKKPKVFKLLKQ